MCVNTFYLDGVVDRFGEPIEIPCGQCYSCQVDLQNMLVNRLFCAWHSHKVSAYVTFTYDDIHLVFEKGFSKPTLCRDHVRKYLDNIRHQSKVKFEYYLCGEYGDSFGRPHYHALFFGLDYIQHYDFFKRTWKYGSVKILPVNSGAFKYVSKYVVSVPSAFKDKEFYDFGLVPPFRIMSRGLGLSVMRDHISELEQKGYFIFHSRKIKVNRYYFNKLVVRNELLLTALYSEQNRNEKLRCDSARSNAMSLSQYECHNADTREAQLKARKLRQKSSLL